MWHEFVQPLLSDELITAGLPALLEEVSELEMVLGFGLPEGLRTFLLEFNGIWVDNNGWNIPIVGSVEWIRQYMLEYKQNPLSFGILTDYDRVLFFAGEVDDFNVWILSGSGKIKQGIYSFKQSYYRQDRLEFMADDFRGYIELYLKGFSSTNT